MNKDYLREERDNAEMGIFNFDIGVVDPYSKLNCSINLH
jgi:hypothetical protein